MFLNSRNSFPLCISLNEHCTKNTCQRLQNLEKFGETHQSYKGRFEWREIAEKNGTSRNGNTWIDKSVNGSRSNSKRRRANICSIFSLSFSSFPPCKKRRENFRGNSINLAMLNVISKRGQRAGAKQRSEKKKRRYLHNGRLLARSEGVF